jgi:succinate-semialdehyde dehydrogenase / glutarate-semialdehyde dehydrogenase
MSDVRAMYLNGEWVYAESNDTYDVINPATGECVGVVTYGDQRDATKAIDAAHQAFPAWSQLTARERAKYLANIAGLIRKK